MRHGCQLKPLALSANRKRVLLTDMRRRAILRFDVPITSRSVRDLEDFAPIFRWSWRTPVSRSVVHAYLSHDSFCRLWRIRRDPCVQSAPRQFILAVYPYGVEDLSQGILASHGSGLLRALANRLPVHSFFSVRSFSSVLAPVLILPCGKPPCMSVWLLRLLARDLGSFLITLRQTCRADSASGSRGSDLLVFRVRVVSWLAFSWRSAQYWLPYFVPFLSVFFLSIRILRHQTCAFRCFALFKLVFTDANPTIGLLGTFVGEWDVLGPWCCFLPHVSQ